MLKTLPVCKSVFMSSCSLSSQPMQCCLSHVWREIELIMVYIFIIKMSKCCISNRETHLYVPITHLKSHWKPLLTLSQQLRTLLINFEATVNKVSPIFWLVLRKERERTTVDPLGLRDNKTNETQRWKKRSKDIKQLGLNSKKATAVHLQSLARLNI